MHARAEVRRVSIFQRRAALVPLREMTLGLTVRYCR
jgi:hypothetical protein